MCILEDEAGRSAHQPRSAPSRAMTRLRVPQRPRGCQAESRSPRFRAGMPERDEGEQSTTLGTAAVGWRRTRLLRNGRRSPPRTPAMRRRISGPVYLCWPPAALDQDLLDDRGLVNEGDDPYRADALGTQEGVGFVNLYDEVRPPVRERLRYRGRWHLGSTIYVLCGLTEREGTGWAIDA